MSEITVVKPVVRGLTIDVKEANKSMQKKKEEALPF